LDVARDFLKKERYLLDAVADEIGTLIEKELAPGARDRTNP
jgi:hypothetical protein